jgi:hypothetical protein
VITVKKIVNKEKCFAFLALLKYPKALRNERQSKTRAFIPN